MTATAPALETGSPVPEPIDWALATRIARRVAGREPLASSYLATSMRRDFESVTEQAEGLVADFTGLRAPGPARRDRARPAGLGRRERRLDAAHARAADRSRRRAHGEEPGGADRALGHRHASSASCSAGSRNACSASTTCSSPTIRGTADADTDAVYYVGANILGLEKRFAFRPRDFRLWIAIHECTHRAQFTAVPWLKPYFLSLVDQALGIVDPDPKRIVQSLVRAADELRQGRNPLDDGGLVALLASPEQRGVHRAGAVADVGARGSRQPGDERARS